VQEAQRAASPLGVKLVIALTFRYPSGREPVPVRQAYAERVPRPPSVGSTALAVRIRRPIKRRISLE
jgi:hypothetical protein